MPVWADGLQACKNFLGNLNTLKVVERTIFLVCQFVFYKNETHSSSDHEIIFIDIININMHTWKQVTKLPTVSQ